MMMQVLKLFTRNNRQIKWAFYVFGGLILFSFAVLGFTFKRLPPEVPMFYSFPWGQDQLGKSIYLIILPLGCLILGMINFILSFFIFPKEPLAAKILALTTCGLTFLGLLTLSRIIFLIF